LKRLIVTADDYGAAGEVNEAVEAAHRHGILTAASLMVAAPAAADAVARARLMPSLRVGLHVVLVEGRPVLPASAVSTLVDRDGAFRTDMAALGAMICVSGRARRQLESEITAQFEAFRDTGLPLDHCNAHKHFHLHPVVGGLIASIGARFGLRAARVPIEPERVLRRIERRTRWRPALHTAPFARMLHRRFRAAGLLTADRLFGLRWSGRMNKERLSGLIRNLPPGLSEIYLHPATGPYPGAAPGYRYREEFDALMAQETTDAVLESSLHLGGFSDFLSAVPSPAAPQGAAKEPRRSAPKAEPRAVEESVS
jgi:hopanoid biosynthesis associated protein HpnK